MVIAGFDIPTLVAMLMVASTPILFAAIGELVVERSGVLNLGVEGMMICGAVCGFAVTIHTENPVLGMLGAALGGALLAALFAVLVLFLLSNQVATGLALTLFGLGLSALIGQGYSSMRPVSTPKLDLGPLSDLPVLGPMFFRHDIWVYGSLLLTFAVWWWLTRTRGGLVLRAVGENHDAAHALGYRVLRIRFLAILFGGACAGLGGGYLSLIRVPQWTEGMTAGAGWIALAIVVFASWRPWRAVLGAYLFGGVTVLQLNLQARGVNIPVQYLSMAPYVITIIVLVLISGRRRARGVPGSLGRVFHASS
ncbi:ABC transporter permease [Haematobacter massiliensis]|nr:ABC transporter permease [Haematobacter massiliensis]OWJ69355.1 ABC transporter permease [Haematobacter massiliensis]OWJ83855.1 ABC transporter permease [Haematobacter massiliensis]QBJ24610.1 ABC transporter permease [Haematobacter massiliensis]